MTRCKVLVVPFLLMAALLGAQAPGEGPLSQADAFLQKATEALAAGAPGTAIDLATSALELAPADSEALLVRARAELPDRTQTAACVADLRQALQSATWRSSAPEDAQAILAEVLLRTGRLGEARALLDPLVSRSPQDPHVLLLLARTQDAANDPAVDRTLAAAAQRFPLVDDFRLLAARRLAARGRRADALSLVATGLKVNPASLPLLLASARLQAAGGRAAAVNAYLQQGGTDPLAALLGMEAGARDRARFLSLFLSHGGLQRQDLVDRAIAAVKNDKALARTLQDALTSFTGARQLDANEDGFWEEQWSFQDGHVVAWLREPAQDGVALYAVQFTHDTPSSITWLVRTGVSYTAHFSQYPYIETVSTAPGTTYFLVPYGTRFAFLQGPMPAPGIAPRIASRIDPPALAAITAASYKEQTEGTGPGVVRTLTLAGGVPTYAEEDLGGDGVINHRIWYVKGVPSRGERTLQDGTLLRETWQGGKLAFAEADTTGDGKVDYRETYGAVTVRTWDYNGDGIPDSRETPGPGGTIVRELSTRLNGVFDLRVTYQGTRIIRMERSGTNVSVRPDPARGLTWIGTPAPAQDLPDMTKGDGVQSIGGKEYLIFALADVVYAEEVP